MLVPDYWAEARLQKRLGKKTITVRRLGWSDVSQEDAESNAQERAADAVRRIEAGESLPRRERIAPYNGAEGVPIREEVIERDGDVAVTRNSYGALCLNTPDVLFADIDLPEPALSALGWIATFATLSLFAGLAVAWNAYGLILVGGGLAVWTARIVGKRARPDRAGAAAVEKQFRQRLHEFLRARPEWRLRLYRTPAGFRLMAVHRTFDPLEEETTALFEAVKSDPTFSKMCRFQKCFRARVSPKPWRIGIHRHLRPRPGTWPVAPARQTLRQQWIAAYDAKATAYAACQFMEELGGGSTDAKAKAVQELHDRLSRAHSGLPIA